MNRSILYLGIVLFGLVLGIFGAEQKSCAQIKQECELMERSNSLSLQLKYGEQCENWRSQHCLETKQEKKAVKVKEDTACEGCMKIVGGLENKLVGKHVTKAELKHIAYDFCSKMWIFKSKCDEFLDKYFDKIAQDLIDHKSPRFICGEIHVCPKQQPIIEPVIKPVMKPVIQEPLKMMVSKQEEKDVAPKKENGAPCEFCKMILGKVEEEVGKKNVTEDELHHVFDKICSKMLFLQNKCHSFVNDNFHKVYKYINEHKSPSFICGEIRLCSSRQPIIEPVIQPIMKKPVKMMRGQRQDPNPLAAKIRQIILTKRYDPDQI